jgi:uncharacterized RDD family membrane protein YckC
MQEPTPSAAVARENVTGARIVAGLIDLGVVIVIGVIVALLFGDSESNSGDDGASFSVQLGTFGTLLLLVLTFGYYGILEAKTGQTLGQLTGGKVAIRTILRIIDGFLFYLVAVITIAASKNDQRIGDMAAGTLVVRA